MRRDNGASSGSGSYHIVINLYIMLDYNANEILKKLDEKI